MEIKYLGGFGVSLKGKKEAAVVDSSTQFDSKKFSGRLLIYSKEIVGKVDCREDQVIIQGPGEYEVGGIEVIGMNSGSNSTVYTVVVDGVSICHLGQLNEALSDKKVDKIENIDVLIVPIGGKLLDGKNVMSLAKKSGANYVIPVAYNEVELKDFLDSVDREGLTPVDSLKVNRDELPEGIEIVVLK